MTVSPESGCRFSSTGFSGGGSQLILATGFCSVVGCSFVAMLGISVTSTQNTVTGCNFSSVGTPINESGAADHNYYSGNNYGVSFLNIIGPSSVVNGVIKTVVNPGTTTGVFVDYVNVSGIDLQFGVSGIGTVRNVGANDLEVRETVVSTSGATDNVTTTVNQGNTYMLNTQANFLTAYRM